MIALMAVYGQVKQGTTFLFGQKTRPLKHDNVLKSLERTRVRGHEKRSNHGHKANAQ